MQRKLLGGDYVPTSQVVIRPAVVVDSGGADCDVEELFAELVAEAFG